MKRNHPSQYHFNPNEEVLCVNASSEISLTKGKVYICESADKVWIRLKEHPDREFYAIRFIPNTSLHRELM